MAQDHLSQFWDFVTERQSIFHKRFELRLPPSWTSDPILEGRLFCNVYRELDRTSLWYITNVARPDLKLESTQEKISLVFSTIFFRQFNNPKTYDRSPELRKYSRLQDSRILYDPDLKYFKPRSLIRDIEDCAPKPWVRKAYTISSHTRGVPTHVDIVKNILEPLTTKKGQDILSKVVHAGSAEEAFNILKTIHGLGGGGFLAYEVLCDLNYTPLWNYKFSENDFVNSGPGAHRGIERIFGDGPPGIDEEITDEHVIRQLQRHSTAELKARSFPFFRGRKLSLRSVEHNLCEFDKYLRKKEFDSGASSHRAVLRKFRYDWDSANVTYLEMLNSRAFSSLYGNLHGNFPGEFV